MLILARADVLRAGLAQDRRSMSAVTPAPGDAWHRPYIPVGCNCNEQDLAAPGDAWHRPYVPVGCNCNEQDLAAPGDAWHRPYVPVGCNCNEQDLAAPGDACIAPTVRPERNRPAKHERNDSGFCSAVRTGMQL